MVDAERESIRTTYNGLTPEQRMYMLSLFDFKEILAELGERLSGYEFALNKIHETISAT